jgi:hypothetical protein
MGRCYLDGMRVALFLAVALPVLGACNKNDLVSCPAAPAASFQLACRSDLVGVVVTGPCATPDGGLSLYLPLMGLVYIQSQGPGVCHVELTFGSGFTYASDVTFHSDPGGPCRGESGCMCPDYFAPASEGTLTVNNPLDTCIDAGVDSGAGADAAGPPDASAEVGGDVGVEE